MNQESRNLVNQIEAILFFKNEPVSEVELAKLCSVDIQDVKEAVRGLQEDRKQSGVVVLTNGEEISLGTHPDQSALIESLQKEELSRDLGRAGLETLAIVLYRGPVSRREIDYIRGVNSGFILRSLLVRGLVERAESESERSYVYKPTLKLLSHLGVSKREELPEFESAFSKIEEFVKVAPSEANE